MDKLYETEKEAFLKTYMRKICILNRFLQLVTALFAAYCAFGIIYLVVVERIDSDAIFMVLFGTLIFWGMHKFRTSIILAPVKGYRESIFCMR